MLSVEHNQCSWFVSICVERLAKAIGKSSVSGLGSGHVGRGLDMCVPEPLNEICGIGNGRRGRNGEMIAWVVTKVGVERRHTNGRVMRVVVGKFGNGEKGRPICLLVIAKRANVVLDCLVDPFGLTIGLGVEGC